MKSLIVAGLVAMTTVLGVAGKGEALPETVPCSVAATLRGDDVRPADGMCDVDITGALITAKFMDFTVIWSDRQEMTTTTMGLFNDGDDGSGIVLADAYARTDEQGVTCAIGDIVNSNRRRMAVAVCFNRNHLQN